MTKMAKAVSKKEEGKERGQESSNNIENTSVDEVLAVVKSPDVKYKLRPRSAHTKRLCDSDWSFDESSRSKSRSSPLSRYRRKTANARERYRMRQINTAFESLRGVLPSWVCSRRAAAEMTKIATLRLASAYIRSLQDILDGNAPEDTCSWVLASILEDPFSRTKEAHTEIPSSHPSNEVTFNTTKSELVSLLCDSSSSQDFEDNLSFLTPMTEPDPVSIFLEGSTPDPGSACWGTGGRGGGGFLGASLVT